MVVVPACAAVAVDGVEGQVLLHCQVREEDLLLVHQPCPAKENSGKEEEFRVEGRG